MSSGRGFHYAWHRFSLWLIAVLAASVVVAVSAPASQAVPAWPPPLPPEKVIPHTDAALASRPFPASADSGPGAAATWPAASEAEVNLAGAAAEQPARGASGIPDGTGPPRTVGALPVTVSAPAGPESVRVRLADQATTEQAGITGVLLSVTPIGGRPGTATIGLNYGSFRNAAGAEFGSRLRLVRLPACATTTPQVPACQVRTPLLSRNNLASQVVSAEVPLPAQPQDGGTEPVSAVLAAVADASGPQGSFEASSLSPSGTWSVTGNSGAFAWTYPIAAPPAATGTSVAPKVTLTYNSSEVDGRIASTNNQSSWIGQGWSYAPGYVERTYRPCADDEDLPASQQTGDLCWAGHIVTMQLGGRSIPLVYDDATRTWHAAEDNGTRVELLTGAANGVHGGEHWRITTTDGVQYWFGRHRGPGWAGQEQTNSTWAVPVYGPRVGDPCYNPAGFGQSSCAQAWRWNLDFVEDPHGSVTAYYYAPETNHYGANNGTTGVAYTRGGTLARVDYGLRTINGSIYGQTVPGQVVFTVIERCVPDAGFSCDPSLFTAANAARWPDTPQDQQCLDGAVCNNHGPSFWSTKRLSTITTQYNTGSGPVRVDTYQLTQTFPTEVEPRQLRLDSLVRTGYASDGSSIALPAMQFVSQALHNRVPGFNSQPAMPHWRMTEVHTDTGAIIAVTYSQPDCGPGSMPTDQANITKLCFPVNWTPPLQSEPVLDYFNKYVTTQVQVQDRNGVSPTQITRYSYLGTPAWHYDDNEVVKPKHRTYGQFRGYPQVEVRTGDPATSDRQTLTRTTYFRGMDADVLPNNGSRTAAVGNSLGDTTADNNLFAGQAYEVQTFEGDGGPQLSTQVTDPTVVATTATRGRPGLRPLTANVVATGRTRTVTALAAGGNRTASTTHRHDGLGRLTATTESGTNVPDVCTINRYAENTTTWIRDRVSESVVGEQACPSDGSDPTPVRKAIRTYYDNSPTLGAVPGTGLPTRNDAATGETSGTLNYATTGRIGYDAAGRPTSVVDALNRTTSTAYTPADGGVLSRVVSTNAKLQTSTVDIEPSRGLTTATADVGGRRTDATYDPLGRLTAVWKPGRAKGTQSAHVTYDYLQRTNGPLAVTTRTLVDYGTGTNYLTSLTLFDALGQHRQTQADDLSNPNLVENRVVTDIFYDSHGWAVRSNNRYTTTGAPATTLISVADSAVDDRTVTSYDGAGRAGTVTAYRGLTATWNTRTVHGGDRVTVLPPQGGVISTTVTDVRGRTAELHQYTVPPTVNGDVVSGGTSHATTYRYTALGQLDRIVDAAGNAWTFGYDLLGRQTTATDPDSGTRTSSYDLAGQLTSTTDARGQTLAYEYDLLGRKTGEFSGSLTGTRLATWAYDTAQFGVGLLASTTRHTPSGNYRTAVRGYTPEGNPWDFWVQIPASEPGLAGNYQTRFSWTTTGLLTATSPVTAGGLPGEDIGVVYDRYGQPKSTRGYNVYVNNSAYTPYGEPQRYELGVNESAGTLTYDRDSQTRRITGVNLSVLQAWPQVDDLRYTYDPAGNITKIVNVQGHPDNGAPTRTQCFRYDPLSRLSQAWTATDGCAADPSAGTVGGPAPYWTSWTFDAVGLRRTQVQHASTGDTTTNYTYPPQGQGSVRPHALTSTATSGPGGTSATAYGYDAVGNTTSRTLSSGNQTLTWDQYNRTATVAGPAGTTSYLYDADGNQLLRRDPGKTTLYLPGQEIVRDTATGVLTGTRYYAHNGAVVALRVGGSNISWLQADQHGTNQVSVKAEAIDGHQVSRRTFDPYGNPIGAGQGVWPDAHGFLNKPVNPVTGLADLGARKYDSGIGRFISVDPVLDLAQPQGWTGYGYANNNPVSHSDPSGLYCDSCNFYQDPANPSAAGNSAGCHAVSEGPCGSGSSPQDDWDLATGQNTNPAKQPTVAGVRIPTFQELKQRPGFARYQIEGSYADAVRDWAWNYCAGGGTQHEEFCAAAAALGWLEPRFDLAGLLWEMTPVADVVNCANGTDSCAWILTNFAGPLGRGAKGLHALGKAGKAADNAADGLRAADNAASNHQSLEAVIRGACSFTANTPVLMADGSTKPIADIHVGDQILATDPNTGQTGPDTVLATYAHQDTVLDLRLDNGATITTTEDHPFWNTTTGRWERADQLRPGDHLHTPTGTTTVNSLNRATTRTTTTHNLTTTNPHTYYVHAGDTPVLVHNTCDGPTSGNPNWQDGSVSPGDGWEWRGPGAPGTPNRGAWYNPTTKETLHPDLDHAEPIGPHYDYRAPDGTFYRMFPDGRIEPK